YPGPPSELVLGELGPDGVALVWVLDMLPLPCSPFKLEAVVGEGPTSPVRTQHTPTVIETSPQLQNISITYRKTKTITRRMGIKIPQYNVPSSVTDKAITKEMHNGLRRVTTTASSLKAEQGSGNISKTQTKATPSGPSSPRTSSEGGPGESDKGLVIDRFYTFEFILQCCNLA
nr:hypothetical protein [Tanacetum cinerariifolium]